MRRPDMSMKCDSKSKGRRGILTKKGGMKKGEGSEEG